MSDNIYYVDEELDIVSDISPDMCFSDYADLWLKENKSQLSPKTFTRYQGLLERINLGIGHLSLCKITTHHLNEFYRRLRLDGVNKRTGGGLSSKTILHHHRLISVILHQAVIDGIIAVNPASSEYMKPPKATSKEAGCLQIRELNTLFFLLRQEKSKWRTLLSIIALTGMRRGEILGLEWQDINFTDRIISICRNSIYTAGKIITKEPKTQKSRRIISFYNDDMLFEILMQYKAEYELHTGPAKRGKRLFVQADGRPMHPDSVNDYIKKFCKKYNFPRFSAHTLRHTHISMLIALNVPIKEISEKVGHSQLSTTCNTYAHFIDIKNVKHLPTIESLLSVSV